MITWSPIRTRCSGRPRTSAIVVREAGSAEIHPVRPSATRFRPPPLGGLYLDEVDRRPREDRTCGRDGRRSACARGCRYRPPSQTGRRTIRLRLSRRRHSIRCCLAKQLVRQDATKAAAESALPALDRLRADWDHYQHVRDYIAAKRQPREPDPALDQLASFTLWIDIGELSVSTLVDDAVEFYVQLATFSAVSLVDLAPAVPDRVAHTLDALDPVNDEGLISITASSFGAGRASAFPIRMGGEIGRLVPLINDVAEHVVTLREIVPFVKHGSALDRLLRCQLPSEINELLRLAVGPAPGAPSSSDRSLLGLYSEPGAPSGPKTPLEGLRRHCVLHAQGDPRLAQPAGCPHRCAHAVERTSGGN